LDKAEREGAVQRMRVVVETPGALGASMATAVVAPPPEAPPIDEPSAPAPMRTVVGAKLDPRLVTASAPASVAAEQYRAMRTRVLYGDAAAPVNLVLVTSPSAGDGKSLTVANLGIA